MLSEDLQVAFCCCL